MSSRIGEQGRLFRAEEICLRGNQKEARLAAYAHPNGVVVVIDTPANRDALRGLGAEIEQVFQRRKYEVLDASGVEEGGAPWASECTRCLYLLKKRERRGKIKNSR